MQVTKTLKKDVLNSYNTWLYSYLNGDVKTYNSYFDATFHFIGSTNNEEYLNKKDSTNYFVETANQLAGKCDLRNESKIVENHQKLIFITHLFDAWFLNEKDWAYYGRFRFSSVMQKKEKQWKFIYQHFSTPDSKTSNGETIGFDKVTLENQELREAIKRRTFELEAKNRELEIETALEKVRSRTMVMQHSGELQKTSLLLDQQIRSLGIKIWGCAFNIYGEKESTEWLVNEKGILPTYTVPRDGIFKDYYKKGKEGESIYIKEFSGKACVDHYEYMSSLPVIGDVIKSLKKTNNGFPTYQIDHVVYFKYGYLLFITKKQVSDAHIVFIRFAKVFEQTYTRFLDLKKVESQTKEAQIEASLERVRSSAMAMHKSDDLTKAVDVVFSELKKLEFKTIRCGIGIFNDQSKSVNVWTTSSSSKEKTSQLSGDEKLEGHPLLDGIYNAWRKQVDFSYILKNKDLEKYYQVVKRSNLPVAPPSNVKQFATQYYHLVVFPAGGLFAFSNTKFSQDKKLLMKRFGEVFHLSFIRHLDLKKAEIQSRESQIQLSLERIRAKAMSMHNSNEIDDVLTILCAQFDEIGILPMSINMTVFDFENNSFIFRETGKYGNRSFGKQTVALDAMDNWQDTVKQWKAENPLAVNKLHFTKEQLPKVWEVFHESFASMPENHKITPKDYPDGIYHTAAKHPFGYLGINQTRPATTNEEQIVITFANEFGRAYQRFIDLQIAEAQIKEARIESALEKVRTVALSLTKSEDMLNIAKVLYEQLLELGFTDIRNAIIDIHNDDETFLDYDYSHNMSSAITKFSFYGDPVIEQQIKIIESSNDAFFEIELKDEQIEELIETRLRNGEKDDPRLREVDHLTYNLYSFGNGAIGISNFGILSSEQKIILKRFRNVFTFAYKRYTDLANAEAQAREAKIETALEKVRSVALSITESTDLLHIAKALFEQLVDLGFSDIRNAIIDVNNEDDKTFLDYDYSHEMGGTTTLMSYDDDTTLEEQVRVIAETTDGFSEMVLEGQQLQDLIEMRRKNGEADDPRLLETKSLSYVLYAFGNGAVGISNFGVISKDQKTILDRFRKVFTFAYQRFKDLQVKEEQSAKLLNEKLRLEKTLTDLQQTQKQLIQSEKMASLGELTAGIAHEIQNPLNFVNNFSEVSKELLDEIKVELEKGNIEEVKAIMNDVIQNLVKINHHGKRADGIVKGMLQHSRASGNQKEPTDINALTDEYLRLAYHGLRAKNKAFNAHLETNYDNKLKTVDIIPQDIGRVILNLFTNAFYAVDEKTSTTLFLDYKPTVSVSSKKLKNKVVITVKDNGNGIPKDIIDKIFQPFFTTKPTGKGTGLGLSMSYDIIKAHEGELSVTTIEGEGSTFKIHLPLTRPTSFKQ